MYYNVLKADDIVKLEENKFERKILIEKENSNISIIALKKNEIIDTHTSENDTLVFVFDGKIEIHFSAEKFTLEKGEIILFKKDDEHKVFALKDSKFMLVKL